MMIYLSGVTNKKMQDFLIAAGIGLIATPKSYGAHVIKDFPYYAADNGAFTDKWVEEPWLDWLAKLETSTCLFAVAPDVYPDAQASLDRGLQYTELLRSMGFPAAIVAQDGAEKIDYPWDEFDCLFIGGARTKDPKDEWKVSPGSWELIRRARAQGKWVHMGRVNSYKRMEWARAAGCHSVDGTYIKFKPDVNVLLLNSMLANLSATTPFPQMAVSETPSHPVHRKMSFNQ